MKFESSKQLKPKLIPSFSLIMCSSTTRLVYGIIVKSWSLLIAGLAFQTLRPVSLAIDIIMLRCRNRSLEMKQGGKDRSILPEEIWNMIKLESIDLAIHRAEIIELERITGEGCGPCDGCGGRHGLDVRGNDGSNFYDFDEGEGEWADCVIDEWSELSQPSSSQLTVSHIHS